MSKVPQAACGQQRSPGYGILYALLAALRQRYKAGPCSSFAGYTSAATYYPLSPHLLVLGSTNSAAIGPHLFKYDEDYHHQTTQSSHSINAIGTAPHRVTKLVSKLKNACHLPTAASSSWRIGDGDNQLPIDLGHRYHAIQL
jgi:hypothetical protein